MISLWQNKKRELMTTTERLDRWIKEILKNFKNLEKKYQTTPLERLIIFLDSDNMSNKLPDPEKLVYTIGVMSMQGIGFDNKADDYMFTRCLALAVLDKYKLMPDECNDGGNDKRFFTVIFRSKKLFCAENEVGGLTIMLPEEY